MLEDPHVGERDSRTEDRQLLLDALMAATDRLIITYTGHDERTNLPRPPAVPVGELLDVVGARTSSSSTRCSRSTRATSTRGGAVELRPRDCWRARGRWPASAPAARRSCPRRWRAREPGPVELDELVRFVEHPVRAFLRQRLGISVGDYTTRSTTRCRWSSTTSSSGTSASGCSTR